MAAIMASAVCVAQTAVKAEKVQMAPTAKAQLFTAAQPGQQPVKSAATGNYYTRPEGSMYVGYDKEFRGYTTATFLNITPFVEGVFINKNATPASAAWSMMTSSGSFDLSQYADANNNLPWTINPSYRGEAGSQYNYPAPVLTKGSDAFTIGNASADASLSSGLVGNDLGPLTFCGNRDGRLIYGYSGFMSTGYLFGTGIASLTDKDTGETSDYISTGLSQHYEKPMTPLYVEDLYALVLSGHGNSKPLQNGAKLTMTITGDDGNVIATLTAGEEDATDMGHTIDETNMGGKLYLYNIVFSQKKEDPVSGQLVATPFVINQPFTVKITGFDETGVDVAFYGYQVAPEDPIEGTEIVGYPKGGSKADEGSVASYSGGLCAPLFFTALMDNVIVAKDLELQDGSTINDCNIIRISDDGNTNTFEKNPNVQSPSVYVYTANQWTNADGAEQYYFDVAKSSDETGDWITGVNVDDSNWQTTTSVNGVNLINFTADAITEGGNWAVGYIHGRGVTSSEPIILLQGTATIDDVPAGVDNVTVDGNAVKANKGIYNLNGQRVSKDFKGVVIQNGKKFIKK